MTEQHIAHRRYREIYDKFLASLSGTLTAKSITQVGGVFGSLVSLLVRLYAEKHQHLVLLTEDLEQSEMLREDLRLLGLRHSVHLLPPPPHLRLDSEQTRREKHSSLLEIVETLGKAEPFVLLGSLPLFFQKVQTPEEVSAGILPLHLGQSLDLEELKEKLVSCGYQRVDFVSGLGEFAIRGGIVDIFSFGSRDPLRLELDDTLVESLRYFSPQTQLSIKPLTKASVLTVNLEQTDEPSRIFSHLPKDTLVMRPEADILFATAIKAGHSEAETEELWEQIAEFSHLEFLRGATFSSENPTLHTHAIQSYLNRTSELVEKFHSLLKQQYDIYFLCDNNGQQERIEEILLE
jgi:transcription-repair coupling factor (superfamily II helicase)